MANQEIDFKSFFESGALPGVVGADIRASAVYGQGMGHNPDAAPYGEQEEDKSDKEEEFKMDDEGEDEDDFNLEDEDEEFDLEREGEGEGDMDRQGVIRTAPNAHLIYKRQNEEGNYDELWIYNTGADMKDELEIRRNILAGTDIPASRTKSDDGTQLYTLSSMGNAQYLQIRGLPN
jgi:sarcosine oxidase delta subunit